MEDKFIYLNEFFIKFKQFDTIHINEVTNWFEEHDKLYLADRNKFYDFRKTLLHFLILDEESIYRLNFNRIIHFYQKLKINKEEENFWLKKQGNDSNE